VFTTSRDGVELWWYPAGEGRPVLLIPGRGDATDLYPHRFTDALIARGCRVIRYDPRDTGLSGDGGSTYTLADMADDAVAVLDAAGVGAAHLVGFSMGGVILIDVALRYPERVASAVLLSALSPDPEAGIGEDFFAVFGADPLAARLQAMGETTDADRDWVESELAAAAERAPARPQALERHQEAAFRLGWPDHERLADVPVSTLVIHGGADRVLPLRHARAFAAIPDTEVVVIRGMGHLPRPAQWDDIGSRVAEHIVAAPHQ
jgi:pimeloyl-ACP methyl ester carboxylesterase